MSAGSVLAEAMRGCLAPLGFNLVSEAAPARAREPWALIEAGSATDWSVKDRRGRELRPALTILAAGDGPDAADALADAVEAAVAGIAAALPGWRIASLVLLRRRRIAEGAGRWRVLIEWRVRMMEEL